MITMEGQDVGLDQVVNVNLVVDVNLVAKVNLVANVNLVAVKKLGCYPNKTTGNVMLTVDLHGRTV